MVAKPFRFLLTYFKTSGTYYTEAVVTWEIRNGGSPGSPQPYLPDVIAKVRGLRDAGGPGALPGLCGEGWPGPILIQEAAAKRLSSATSNNPDDFHGDGVPHLLLPPQGV